MNILGFILVAFILGCLGILLVATLGIIKDTKAIRIKATQLRTLKDSKCIATTSRAISRFAAPEILTHQNWTDFEGRVPGLFQVIVLTDTVDQPLNGLERAVLENFKRGVKYTFIVSGSKGDSELKGFYGLFEKLAGIAIEKYKVTYKLEDLVTILRLPIEWDNVPFVFYRIKDAASGDERIKTFGFRGDAERKGIANRYIAIDQDNAEALVKLLMASPPERIESAVKALLSDVFVDAALLVRSAEGNVSRN